MIILYHIVVKTLRERKYIPFVVIKNMKCNCRLFTSRFPKMGLKKELQGVREFNKKQIIY